MAQQFDPSLIDKIYEASFITDKWEDVLDDLCAISGTEKAAMFANSDGEVSGWIGTKSIQSAMEVFIKDDWGSRSEQSKRAIERREARFMVDHDLFTDEEMEQSATYRDFLGPQGLRWGAGSVISSPSKDAIIFTLHRAAELGPVEREAADRLTALRPHLARAALAAARLKLEQARAALQALEALGLPAAALDRKGRLKTCNTLFTSVMPAVVEDHPQRIRFRNGNADLFFAGEVGRWETTERGRLGSSFPIRAEKRNTPHIVHLVPVCGDNRDIFAAAHWLMIMVPVEQSGTLDLGLLEGLFDLTPAEAAIASGLVCGNTLQDIATQRVISVETARTQLKAVMAKTGTNRQAELVGLLANVRVLGY